MRTLSILNCIIFVVAGGLTSVLAKEPSTTPSDSKTWAGTCRTWTDTAGRSVRAAFLRCEGTNVCLQTDDGKIYTFPLTRLCATDRMLIEVPQSGTTTASPDGARYDNLSITAKNMGVDELTLLVKAGEQKELEHKIKPGQSVEFTLTKDRYAMVAGTYDARNLQKAGTASIARVVAAQGDETWTFRQTARSGQKTWVLEQAPLKKADVEQRAEQEKRQKETQSRNKDTGNSPNVLELRTTAPTAVQNRAFAVTSAITGLTVLETAVVRPETTTTLEFWRLGEPAIPCRPSMPDSRFIIIRTVFITTAPPETAVVVPISSWHLTCSEGYAAKPIGHRMVIEDTQSASCSNLSVRTSSGELCPWYYCGGGQVIWNPKDSRSLRQDIIYEVPKGTTSATITDHLRVDDSSFKNPETKEHPTTKRSPNTKTSTLLPPYTQELVGPKEVRVRNPNDFDVNTCIRNGDEGKDLYVPAKGIASVFIPNGRYDIYFVYSDRTNALFQGDSFTLNNNRV